MKVKFLLLVVLQLVLLLGIIAYREYWIRTGETVLLQTAPVDPIDIFRGHYLSLRYDISDLNLVKLSVEETFSPNQTVYVSLQKGGGGVFLASSVSKTPPTNRIFIQGRVQDVTPRSTYQLSMEDDSGLKYGHTTDWLADIKEGDRVTFCYSKEGRVVHYFKETQDQQARCQTGASVTGVITKIDTQRSTDLFVEYGIESYFMEQQRARDIESRPNVRSLQVEISLRKDGKAMIKALRVGGKVVN